MEDEVGKFFVALLADVVNKSLRCKLLAELVGGQTVFSESIVEHVHNCRQCHRVLARYADDQRQREDRTVGAMGSQLFLLLDEVAAADKANDHSFSQLLKHVEHFRRDRLIAASEPVHQAMNIKESRLTRRAGVKVPCVQKYPRVSQCLTFEMSTSQALTSTSKRHRTLGLGLSANAFTPEELIFFCLLLGGWSSTGQSDWKSTSSYLLRRKCSTTTALDYRL